MRERAGCSRGDGAARGMPKRHETRVTTPDDVRHLYHQQRLVVVCASSYVSLVM